MLAVVSSGALFGIKAEPVQVEVNTAERGEAKVILVGLPDTAVRESNDRVISALNNCGFKIPRTRTTINLAPGNIRKEGPIYDLPIALAFLASSGQLKAPDLGEFLIGGELSLSGATRPIKGALSMAMLARDLGRKGILLPPQSAQEAAIVEDFPVFQVDSLDQAVRFLDGSLHLEPLKSPLSDGKIEKASQNDLDFSEIRGQQAVRRAVEIAVTGGHNLLMIGPPGSGKSMIARRIPSIIPKPKLEDYIETLTVHSAAGTTLTNHPEFLERPFRSPHHTISDVGLLGGGAVPGPGEISLAHHGVLFLDELPEFKRSALEVLRQPLEDAQVTISRSAGKVTLPCSFMLVAAMNPCPCGYLGDSSRNCRCSATQIQRYRSRISGPLLDRIDIHIEAPPVNFEDLRKERPSEPSESIRCRIQASVEIQNLRFKDQKTPCNARMNDRQIRQYCALNDPLGDLLQQAMEQLHLSARAYTRILKVARTIADLEEAVDLDSHHLLEAIHYRTLDRNVFY